jgi:hypothetical protein
MGRQLHPFRQIGWWTMPVPATTTTVVPDAFLPLVVPFVASAPRAVVTQVIAAILKEFLHETQVWQETLAAITLVAGQKDYALNPSDSTNTIFDTIIWSKNASEFFLNPGEDYTISANKAGISLIIAPPTGVTGTFTARIALRLKTSGTPPLFMDDRIFEDWHEVIAHGAIARIKNTPGVWSDPKGAGYLLNKYLMGKAAARIEVAHGSGNSIRQATYNLRGYL